MEYVVNTYKNTIDLFFLFANETVLDFYPRFGFVRKSEFKYVLDSDIPKSNYSARKLNIKNSKDFELIKRLVSNRIPLTTIFGANKYDFITMWHLIYVFSDNIYYLKDEDVIVICSIEKYQLQIWEVIFSKSIDFNSLLIKIVPERKINSLNFYFPPDQLNFPYNKIIQDNDSLLFVKGNFSINGKQFKFPNTAKT